MLLEQRPYHIRVIGGDGVAVQRQCLVELLFVIDGADIDGDTLLMEIGDFRIGGLLCPDANLVEDGAVELARRVVEVAVGEALEEDVWLPLAQQLKLAWMEGEEQRMGEEVVLLADVIDLPRQSFQKLSPRSSIPTSAARNTGFFPAAFCSS